MEPTNRSHPIALQHQRHSSGKHKSKLPKPQTICVTTHIPLFRACARARSIIANHNYYFTSSTCHELYHLRYHEPSHTQYTCVWGSEMSRTLSFIDRECYLYNITNPTYIQRGARCPYLAVCCKCVAVCCSVSQCVAVCCTMLQCVAVCCSML